MCGISMDRPSAGFCDRFLEEELARRYKDAAPATLAILQQRWVLVLQAATGAHTYLITAQLFLVRSSCPMSSLRSPGMQEAVTARQLIDLGFYASIIRVLQLRGCGQGAHHGRPKAAGGGGCGLSAQGRWVDLA
jgi:hypothetical protein